MSSKDYKEGFHDGMLKCMEYITLGGKPSDMFERMDKICDQLTKECNEFIKELDKQKENNPCEPGGY